MFSVSSSAVALALLALSSPQVGGSLCDGVNNASSDPADDSPDGSNDGGGTHHPCYPIPPQSSPTSSSGGHPGWSQSSGNKRGVGGGTAAGIALAIIVTLTLALLFLFFWRQRKFRKSRSETDRVSLEKGEVVMKRLSHDSPIRLMLAIGAGTGSPTACRAIGAIRNQTLEGAMTATQWDIPAEDPESDVDGNAETVPSCAAGSSSSRTPTQSGSHSYSHSFEQHGLPSPRSAQH